jgi:hypothetical protein
MLGDALVQWSVEVSPGTDESVRHFSPGTV